MIRIPSFVVVSRNCHLTRHSPMRALQYYSQGEFLMALVSAHSVYAEFCMVQIVRNFVGRGRPRGLSAMSEDEAEAAVAEGDQLFDERVMPRACSML